MRLPLRRNHNKLLQNLLSVTGIVLFSKVLGFFRQILKANLFGATLETDMISLSEGLVGNMEYILEQTLVTVFVPIYHQTKEKGAERTAQFVSNSLAFFSLTGLVVALAAELFALPFSRLIAPSYTPEMSRVLSSYIRIFAPGLILILMVAYFAALLKANERFVLSEVTHLSQSVVYVVVMLCLWRVCGIRTLMIAFYLYAAINLLSLSVGARAHWRLKSVHLLRDSDLRRMVRMASAPMLGYSMVFINQQVDKILVSGLEIGTLTAMGYAAVLSNFVSALIGSFCSVLYTYLSQQAAKGNHANVAELTRRNIVMLVTLLLPVSLLTLMNARDIVSVVYGRGAFDEGAVDAAARALMGYALMFAPVAVRELFARLFFCYGDSRRPTVNSVIGIALNIALSVALCPRFGVLGVTAATSLSVYVSALLNIITFSRKYSFFTLRPVPRYFPLWILAGGICIALSRIGSFWWGSFRPIVRFFLIALVAGGGYFIAAFPAIVYSVRQEEATEENA